MMTIGDERHGRGERHVVRDPDVRVDDVAHEGRARPADQQRRDVVPEGQREREDRPGHDPRQGEREQHQPGGPPGPRAQVLRRLDLRGRDALQRRVHRDDHERQPQVAEHGVHGPVRVDQVHLAGADPAQGPVQEPAVREDQQPGVHLGQVARPQRQQDRHEQGRPGPGRRDPGHEVGEREGDDGVRHGDRRRHRDRPHDDAPVGRAGEDRGEVVQAPDPLDVGGERVDLPEGRDQQDDQRGQVEQDEPGQRRGEQDGGPRPRPPPQCAETGVFPLASGAPPTSPFPLHCASLLAWPPAARPSSLVPRSSVQSAPRPFGSVI